MWKLQMQLKIKKKAYPLFIDAEKAGSMRKIVDLFLKICYNIPVNKRKR